MQTLKLLKASAVALTLGMVALPIAAQARPQRHRINQNRNRPNFEGVVTSRKSNHEFNALINGKTYNVYTRNVEPFRLSKSDYVHITGKRVGHNDIRNARVEILRNH